MKTVTQRAVKGNRNDAKRRYLDTRCHTSSKKPQNPYSVRLSAKYQTKRKLVAMLSKLDRNDEAERMNRCCEKFGIITCGRHIVARYPTYRCENRLCPFCAERRSKRLIAKYLPIVLAYAKVFKTKHSEGLPCHLVLTLKHRKGETPVMMRKRLWNGFVELRKTDLFKSLFDGGLFTIETKPSQDGVGNNTHLHGCVFRFRKLTKEELQMLKDEWFAITGDSHNLRLDPIFDIRKGLTEICKYINKYSLPENMTLSEVRGLVELKGLKMCETFGHRTFRKFAIDFDPDEHEATEPQQRFEIVEGECCPVCDEPLHYKGVMTTKELIGFARRIEAVPKFVLPNLTE